MAMESRRNDRSYHAENGLSSWEYGPIDAARLKDRAIIYASKAGAGKELKGETHTGSMVSFLRVDLPKGRRLVRPSR